MKDKKNSYQILNLRFSDFNPLGSIRFRDFAIGISGAVLFWPSIILAVLGHWQLALLIYPFLFGIILSLTGISSRSYITAAIGVCLALGTFWYSWKYIEPLVENLS